MMACLRSRCISKSILQAACRRQNIWSSSILHQEAVNDFSSVDQNFERDRLRKIDGETKPRDRITYFYLGAPRIIYASLARLTLIKVKPVASTCAISGFLQLVPKFVASMSATADVLALASAEFDISSVVEGTTLTVKWRGKPVFVRHRTDEEIAEAQNVEQSALPDPQADADRAPTPEW